MWTYNTNIRSIIFTSLSFRIQIFINFFWNILVFSSSVYSPLVSATIAATLQWNSSRTTFKIFIIISWFLSNLTHCLLFLVSFLLTTSNLLKPLTWILFSDVLLQIDSFLLLPYFSLIITYWNTNLLETGIDSA